MADHCFKWTLVVRLMCCCPFLVNTSDVLTLASETENRFVLEQLWSSGFLHHSVWLGMYFNTDSKNPRTGQRIATPCRPIAVTRCLCFQADSMAWVDGSPMDYVNWPDPAPDSRLLAADSCVTTRVDDGAWHLSQCADRLGFVCKATSGEFSWWPSDDHLGPSYRA